MNKTEPLMTDTAAVYYVGDLCYVMLDEWDEIVDQTVYDNSKLSYQLADGREYFMISTMYGDGTYNDLDGNPYSVDSGTIGAIKVSDIRNLDALKATLESGLGHIHTFDYTLRCNDCDYFEGKINIGGVMIDTDDLEEGYDYEEDDEE